VLGETLHGFVNNLLRPETWVPLHFGMRSHIPKRAIRALSIFLADRQTVPVGSGSFCRFFPERAPQRWTRVATTAGDEAATAVLDATLRVFVVSSSLSEQTASGGECGLTPGDVIARLGDSPDADQRIPVAVLSSKHGDCAVGSQFQAPVQELVDMHNDFLRQLDSGLGALTQEEGQNGLPAGPAAGLHLAPGSQPETPDATAPTMLEQQQESADQAEAEIRQSIQSGSDN
jgi:hypothetical protein